MKLEKPIWRALPWNPLIMALSLPQAMKLQRRGAATGVAFGCVCDAGQPLVAHGRDIVGTGRNYAHRRTALQAAIGLLKTLYIDEPIIIPSTPCCMRTFIRLLPT